MAETPKRNSSKPNAVQAAAALGAVTGGEVFERMKRPENQSGVSAARTALAGMAATDATRAMLSAHASLAPHRTAAAARPMAHPNPGWSNEARIASALKRGVALPGEGPRYKG